MIHIIVEIQNTWSFLSIFFTTPLPSVYPSIFQESNWPAMALATLVKRDLRIICLKTHLVSKKFIDYIYLVARFICLVDILEEKELVVHATKKQNSYLEWIMSIISIKFFESCSFDLCSYPFSLCIVIHSNCNLFEPAPPPIVSVDQAIL